MRSALLISALLAASLAGSGCMKVHIDTVIDADGGGTTAIAFAMNRQVADAVNRLGELDERGRDQQDLAAVADLDRDELAAACEAAGVRIARHEFADDITGVRLDLELAFDHVADLSRALAALSFDAVSPPGVELRITRTAEGDYQLANAAIGATAPDSAAVDPNRPPDPVFLREFKVLLDHVAELDIRRTITVPGEVVSSNAREVVDRTSIWVINAANMLEAQDSGLDPRIVFRSEGLPDIAPNDR